MKTLKTTLLLAMFMFLVNAVSAHSLWIETAANGKAGVAQQVKLYYGEFAKQEREELPKWHSDLGELTLWLAGTDGKKEKLTVTRGENFCSADFTPAKDGIYTLMVSHKSKDLSGKSQLEFSASAVVRVGKAADQIDAAANTNELKVLPVGGAKINAPLKAKVWHKGAEKAGATVLVFSPSGWSQELTTGADGTVSFVPLWPGKYVLEATNFDKTPGEYNGNQYSALWQGATYSFDVSK